MAKTYWGEKKKQHRRTKFGVRERGLETRKT